MDRENQEYKSKMGSDGSEKTPNGDSNTADDHSHATNEDLEEFENVSNEIDSINAYLDSIENNVDSLKDQLLTILASNREILKEMKAEREANEKGGNNEDQKPMET